MIKLSSLNKKRIIFIPTGIVFLFLVVYTGYFLFIDPYGGIGGGAAHVYNYQSGDIHRQKALNEIQNALEIYISENSYYPEKLSTLIELGYITQETIIDPVTKQIYEYAVDDQQQKYVIKIPYGTLPNNVDLDRHLRKAGREMVASKLEEDIDGSLYGIDCNDPVYCAGNSF